MKDEISNTSACNKQKSRIELSMQLGSKETSINMDHETIILTVYGISVHSVSRASKFSVLKLIEIVIMRVYYTIPFGLSFFR